MENAKQVNPGFGAVEQCGLFLDKLHSCADCPIRRMGMARPKSVFARIHAWHAAWWPGWKFYRARARAAASKGGARN